MKLQYELALLGLSEPTPRSAVISECGSYRYELWRRWDLALPYVCFIGLNPSIADATEDDPTIRKCVKYARAWNYGALCMVNLFAFRATEPADMMRAADPVGPGNDWHVLRAVCGSGLAVAAWGGDGDFQGRSVAVRALLAACRLHRLALTKAGEPRHPLYLLDNLVPVPLEALPPPPLRKFSRS